MKFVKFIVFLYLFLWCYPANAIETCEINVSPKLIKTLEYHKEVSDKLKNILTEYGNVLLNETFDKSFYNKINSFIKENPNSSSSLSALLLIFSMCRLENDEYFYIEQGKQILDFIIKNYSQTPQGKMAMLYKGEIKREFDNPDETLKYLKDNYEVILSVEKDINYKNCLYELNMETSDPIAAEYLFLLGNVLFKANRNEEAIQELKKIIELYPNSECAEISKKTLKARTALGKGL